MFLLLNHNSVKRVSTDPGDDLCLSDYRCFQAEHGGRDAQVHDTHHSRPVGSVCLGFHLFLGFRHVFILFSGTLSKVEALIPFSKATYPRWLHHAA